MPNYELSSGLLRFAPLVVFAKVGSALLTALALSLLLQQLIVARSVPSALAALSRFCGNAFAVWSIPSCLAYLSPTNITLPLAVPFPFGRQFVPTLAVCLTSIDCRWARAAKHVIALWPKFDVCGITARRVVALQMIQYRSGLTTTLRQRLNGPCVKQPMNSFVPTAEVDNAVTVSVCALPLPATRCHIDADVGKDSRDLFYGKTFDYKVFYVWHDLKLFLSDCVGAAGMSRFGGPLIITQRA